MEAKYKIDRTKFINWLSRNYLGSMIQTNRMTKDLIEGGEYVVTADELLQMQKHVPGYLIEGECPVSVASEKCELIYKQ